MLLIGLIPVSRSDSSDGLEHLVYSGKVSYYGVSIVPSAECGLFLICRCGRDYCTSQEIMSIADAMATNGMKEAGYEYINFDGKRVGRRRGQGG